MTQWAEELLNSIHNMDITDNVRMELSINDIIEELPEFNVEELTILHEQLSRIKTAVLGEKRRQIKRSER